MYLCGRTAVTIKSLGGVIIFSLLFPIELDSRHYIDIHSYILDQGLLESLVDNTLCLQVQSKPLTVIHLS